MLPDSIHTAVTAAAFPDIKGGAVNNIAEAATVLSASGMKYVLHVQTRLAAAWLESIALCHQPVRLLAVSEPTHPLTNTLSHTLSDLRREDGNKSVCGLAGVM